jgi:RNA polymerase sigma-70 factor (ECF subfamily)
MAGGREHPSEGVALIRRMAARDHQAFEHFYDRYAPPAFSLIRRIVGHASEAEDVLQEVFWQAWQDAGSYDDRRGSPEAWLLTRARSRAIDRVRANRRRGETFVLSEGERGAGLGAAGAQGNPGQEAENRVTARSALALLSAPERRVLELAYFGGYTQEEIARNLGEPLGTVKSRMRTALERLRGIFGGSR